MKQNCFPAGIDSERNAMVMMTQNSVEALLNSGPRLDSVEYRNAWSTVGARLARSTNWEKRAEWQALKDRLTGLGEPMTPKPMSQSDALEKAQKANEARAVGRSRATILRRIDEAQYKRALVTDTKPWVFEAALQMVEDGEVILHSAMEDFAERGPAAAAGRRKIRRVILAPYDGDYVREAPWKSKRRQAEEDGRI